MAVFSLENGEAGVDGLKVWLLNIQVNNFYTDLGVKSVYITFLFM